MNIDELVCQCPICIFYYKTKYICKTSITKIIKYTKHKREKYEIK